MSGWSCGRCARSFGRTNQSHTCVPASSLDSYFSARPPFERAIFEAVASQLAATGPFTAEAVSVGILIKRTRTFAELRPQRGRVVLSLLLSRTVADPRVVRVLGRDGRRRAHFLHLTSPDDVDATVRDLLIEAYFSSRP